MKEKEFQIQQKQEQIQQFLQKYESIYSSKFHLKEKLLVEQLEQHALKLKSVIQEFRKKTSEETIQSLILKKRQEMESQRLKLEISWRQLTQKYKKLQEQNKLLADQNRQAQYDLKLLKEKLEQLKYGNQELTNRIEKLKEQRSTFLTQNESKYEQNLSLKNKMSIKCKKKRSSSKFTDNTQNWNASINIRPSNLTTDFHDPRRALQEFLSRPKIRDEIFEILRSN